MRLKIFILIILLFFLFGCTDASLASYNLSKEADQFRVYRRVVFYNGITGTYMLVIEGFLSINVDESSKQLEITVRTGDKDFKKHYLGLSDNVTYFAEQMDSNNIELHRYKVIFRPSVIIPDIELK